MVSALMFWTGVFAKLKRGYVKRFSFAINFKGARSHNFARGLALI